jgi:signal transduction histidine kinase
VESPFHLDDAGLRDFWLVYDARYDEVQSAALEAARRHPELAPIVAAMSAAEIAQESRRSRGLLRRAILEQDWQPYLADLRRQGAAYAAVGVTFSGWHAILRIGHDVLVPALIEKYVGSPRRLATAIVAMSGFFDAAMATIGQHYLTEKRRADENQRALANRELEAFSYSVAHDLRAPLRGMNGFARMLLDDYKEKLDADGLDALVEIQRNAARMGALIDALLSLSRVTRTEPKPVRVDLTAMARATAGQIGAAHPERSVEVKVEEGLVAQADPQLVQVLLQNLLENAWKFTSKVDAARIEVASVAADGERAFFVRDNGAGFDMAFAERLFAPFQRLHTIAEYPGTGIGLATVQRIAHRHGGRAWAEARVGEGATFYFTLTGDPAESTRHSRCVPRAP